MSSSTHRMSLPFLGFFLASLGLAACSSSDPPAPDDGRSSNNLERGVDEACKGKACGVDCTPEGSDEPFNCNVSGACVAVGQSLDCPPSCPEFLADCREGDGPADLDGDGCIDGCKPL